MIDYVADWEKVWHDKLFFIDDTGKFVIVHLRFKDIDVHRELHRKNTVVEGM